MKHNLGDRNRIEHILEAISDLQLFLKDVDFESFEKIKKNNQLLKESWK
jgi:uncharacterized protein with HEPN domain